MFSQLGDPNLAIPAGLKPNPNLAIPAGLKPNPNQRPRGGQNFNRQSQKHPLTQQSGPIRGQNLGRGFGGGWRRNNQPRWNNNNTGNSYGNGSPNISFTNDFQNKSNFSQNNYPNRYPNQNRFPSYQQYQGNYNYVPPRNNNGYAYTTNRAESYSHIRNLGYNNNLVHSNFRNRTYQSNFRMDDSVPSTSGYRPGHASSAPEQDQGMLESSNTVNMVNVVKGRLNDTLIKSLN